MNNNLNIVICSKTKYLSDLIIKLLKEKGYSSLVVIKNKVQLLDFCQNNNPNVVIIDLDNADLKSNSSNIIRDLIKVDEKLLILAISDDISDDFKNLVIESGAKEYLCKPFQPAYLWERIIRINNNYISMQKKEKSTANKSSVVLDNDYLNLPKFKQTSNDSFYQKTSYHTEDNNSKENFITQFEPNSNTQEEKNKNTLKSIISSFFKK